MNINQLFVINRLILFIILLKKIATYQPDVY